MGPTKTKEILSALSHLVAFFLGGVTIYFVMFPVSYIWGTFFGVEIHSQASFPLRHMARMYSVPGFGDQQLICIVDGKTVYRTGDWEPGNVDEKISWDESGTIVTFIASRRRVFIYDTQTGLGKKE
jgi:hypothetical protein